MIDQIEKVGSDVNPTKYRVVHGKTSFEVAIPPDFAREIGVRHGTNVRIELVDGAVVIRSADSTVTPPAVQPKGRQA